MKLVKYEQAKNVCVKPYFGVRLLYATVISLLSVTILNVNISVLENIYAIYNKSLNDILFTSKPVVLALSVT